MNFDLNAPTFNPKKIVAQPAPVALQVPVPPPAPAPVAQPAPAPVAQPLNFVIPNVVAANKHIKKIDQKSYTDEAIKNTIEQINAINEIITTTKLDKIKPREEWTWGDIYNRDAEPLRYVCTWEEGIKLSEEEWYD